MSIDVCGIDRRMKYEYEHVSIDVCGIDRRMSMMDQEIRGDARAHVQVHARVHAVEGSLEALDGVDEPGVHEDAVQHVSRSRRRGGHDRVPRGAERQEDAATHARMARCDERRGGGR